MNIYIYIYIYIYTCSPRDTCKSRIVVVTAAGPQFPFCAYVDAPQVAVSP